MIKVFNFEVKGEIYRKSSLYISNFTVLEVYKIKAMTIVIDLSKFVCGGSVYPLETK